MRKSLALSKQSESNGFTLVELLIVMGVLAVLVVTILVSLNPAEASKKARDTKRMKDLRTLEAIILQYIADGGAPFCNDTNGCNSALDNGGKQNCNNSWILYSDGSPVNLCNYTKIIPVDPSNGQSITVVCCSAAPGTITGQNGRYYLKMVGSDYKIMALQESKSDLANVINDGGIEGVPGNESWVEVFSDKNIMPW